MSWDYCSSCSPSFPWVFPPSSPGLTRISRDFFPAHTLLSPSPPRIFAPLGFPRSFLGLTAISRDFRVPPRPRFLPRAGGR